MTNMKLPALRRLAEVSLRDTMEGDEDDVIELSIASEEPYERWFGVEILGHKTAEVNLDWMASGRAPLLVDHDARVDSQVGTLTKVWLEGQKTKAVARFGQDARSQAIKARVKSGDLTNISVGYRVEEMELVSEKKGEAPVYRVTRWTPMEASIVTIPADMTVGVGREDGGAEAPVRIVTKHTNTTLKGSTNMEPEIKPIEGPSPDQILAGERKRVADIEALGARFNRSDLARDHIGKGTSVDLFRGVLIETLGADTVAERNMQANSLGLTRKEAQRFSFTRLIASAMDPSPSPAMLEAAKFEREVCSAELARGFRTKRNLRGNAFTVPIDILREPMVPMRRDLNVGTSTAGGHTVSTDLMAQDFISLLRNRMMVAQMGARVMSGLEGNVALPRQTGGATFYWVAESGAPTESQQAFDQVTLSPKTGGAFTDYSRRLMLQSSMDVESFVRDDLVAIIARGVDLAALHGTGSSNQPTGIASTSGINSIALGTNGLAPTWAHIVDMETQVAVDNADIGSLGYLTNAKVRGKLKTTEKASSTAQFVWQDGAENMGSLNGYRAGVSNQVRSDLTKGSSSGVCSALFFGNWDDLIIGQWSGIDILVDPYTGSTAGTVRVVALQDVDIAVRHPESFSYIADALTA